MASLAQIARYGAVMQANGHTISLKVPQTGCVKTSENPCGTRSTSVLLQLSPARDEMGLRLVSAA